MAIDLEKYAVLKKFAEDSKTKADQAVGEMKQLKRQLKDEYGCKEIAEAEKLHSQIQKEVVAGEKEYQMELAKLIDEFPELAGDTDE